MARIALSARHLEMSLKSRRAEDSENGRSTAYGCRAGKLRSQNYDSDQGDLFQLESTDPYLDGLLRSQVTETDRAERIALIEQIQDHVIDSAYTIPLLLDTQIFAVAPHIHDFGNAANSVPWFYDT